MYVACMLFCFVGGKKSRNWSKNLDSNSGLRQMGVFDKELTRLTYECDIEKKWKGSRKMSSVCLGK